MSMWSIYAILFVLLTVNYGKVGIAIMVIISVLIVTIKLLSAVMSTGKQR